MKKVLSFLIVAILGFTFISESKAQVYTSYSYSYYSPYDYDFPYFVTDVIHNNYYGYQVVDAVSFYNGPHLAFGLTLVQGNTYFDVVIDNYGRVVNRVAYHAYPRTHVWVNYFPHRRDVVYYYPRGHRDYHSHRHVYVSRGYHKDYDHHYDKYRKHHYDRHQNHHKGNKHYDNDRNHRMESREPARNRNYKKETQSGNSRIRYANADRERSDTRYYSNNSRSSNSRAMADNRNVQPVRNRGSR